MSRQDGGLRGNSMARHFQRFSWPRRFTHRRDRANIAAILSIVLVAGALSSTPSVSAAGIEATLGRWETLAYDSKYTTIHAAVLRTGKVFIMAGSENIPENLTNGIFQAEVWDPKAGTMTQVPPPYDMFCAAHAFLPDGKLLIAGGTEAYPTSDYVATNGASGVYYRGSKRARLFDPVAQRFEPVPDMAGGRWYPTLAGLGNGDVYAFSGLDIDSKINTLPEVYAPNTTGGSWRTTPAVPSSWPLYPHLSLLKNGQLFYSGGFIDNYNIGTMSPGLLDVNSSQFVPVPRLSANDRREAATVLLPPAQAQKVMIVGGGDPAVRNVDIIDLNTANPSYTPGPPMRSPRLHVSAILLPDGKVFITGGGRHGRGEAPVFETEMYDPRANTMTPMANSSVPRVYHSVAMLLPDGRVATAGGQPVYGQRGELRIEVYSPPYLFKGSRPTITSATTELNYGGQATVEIGGGSKGAGRIKTLNLVRPASITHSFDSEQRVIPMTFQQGNLLGISSSKLVAQVPSDPNVAPPGWYMLFAVDDQGIPSVASWVHLNPGTGSGSTTTTTSTTTTSTTSTTTTTSTTSTTSTTTTTTTSPTTTTTTSPATTTTSSTTTTLASPSTNVALNKAVTSSGPFYNGTSGAMVVDGNKDTAGWADVGPNPQWVQVDLGQSYALSRVNLWHYYGDGRTYNDIIVQVSDSPDFSTRTTVFNNDFDNSSGQGAGTDAPYAEAAIGKEILVNPTVTARYVRTWVNGSNVNPSGHFVELEAWT